MLSETLMIRVMAAEGIALCLALSVYFGHGIWHWWNEKRNGPKLARARATIIEGLGASQPTQREIDTLRSLSPQLQIQLINDIAPILSGEHLKWLAEVSEQLGLGARARAKCGSRRWSTRLEGTRLLTMLGDYDDLLPKLLNDRNPAVQAQAIEWAAGYPTPEVVTGLIDLLEDTHSLHPFAIHDTLLRIGNEVVEPLAKYIANHSGRRVEEALEVAAGLADHRFMEAALFLRQDESPRVRALVANLMGALGGEVGVGTLGILLEDPEPRVRAAAARATGRLKHWPVAKTLATLLTDSSWEVRREAGAALHAVGAPGILLLRRCLSDSNIDAVDMARLVLDLPVPGDYRTSFQHA